MERKGRKRSQRWVLEPLNPMVYLAKVQVQQLHLVVVVALAVVVAVLGVAAVVAVEVALVAVEVAQAAASVEEAAALAVVGSPVGTLVALGDPLPHLRKLVEASLHHAPLINRLLWTMATTLPKVR